MTVALVTAVFGDYDDVKPLPAGHGFDDAVCVTDNPDLVVDGWRIVVKPGGDNPRLLAKVPKMLPFDLVKTEFAVWIDASCQIVGDGFRDFCINAMDGYDIVVWDHPEDRDCLYQEATYCQDWPKYSGNPIREQTAHYRREGMPEHFGLWACGTIAWRNNNNARKFGYSWLRENERWSIQDQVSFPFLVWRMSPRLGTFPANELRNEFLQWHNHKGMN